MDRAYVTCHMVMSLDGKIDGAYHEAPDSEKAGVYYYDEIFSLGSSMAGGRVTTCMYSPQPAVEYTPYAHTKVPDGDYILYREDGHYCFIYDREGKCQWDSPITRMGDVSMQIVEVVSERAPSAYLAYLRQIGISYLIVDSVRSSLTKMHSLLGVDKLVLTGGAAINGGFLKEDVIDAFSIVVMPYVEGGAATKALVDTDSLFCPSSFAFTQAKPLPDGAVHLRFERRRS